MNFLQLSNSWFHPYHNTKMILINNNEVEIKWTNRANRELNKLSKPLIVELQLYFSCMVTKRIFFHKSTDFEKTRVNNKLAIAFRILQSAYCEPAKLTKNILTKKVLTSKAALQMHPSLLQLDYYNSHWIAEYYI